MRAAECCISLGIIRVEIDGALKELARLVVIIARCMRKVISAAQHVFVGRKLFGGFGEDSFSLEAGELYRRRADDAPGDVVLHGKDVIDLGVVRFRPDVPPGCGLGQLDTDANTISGTSDIAFEQITRIEEPPDLGRRGLRVFEWKARRFGDDEQVRETAERRNDVLVMPSLK